MMLHCMTYELRMQLRRHYASVTVIIGSCGDS